jgi:putative peptidoglycan lipid II flippase
LTSPKDGNSAPTTTGAGSVIASTEAGPGPEPLPPVPSGLRTPSLASAVRIVSSMTLLSRITGLARDVLLARLFGATLVGSAFAAGFAIPNTFRRLFGEGALTAAFIPEYTQAHKHDPALARRIASATVVALLLATTLIVVVIEALLMGILLLSPASPGRTLSLHLIMLMLPFMPLVCAAAILAGILQVHGRFAPASSGPLLLNGFIIVAGLYAVATGQLGQPRAAYMLGVVTVISGFTQCIWFFYLLRRHLGMRMITAVWRTSREPAASQALGRVRRRFVPALIGMGTLQISALIDMVIAMWPIWFGAVIFGLAYPLDESSNSILVFTQRLYQFPLGVFGIAVATAAFPILSRHADQPAAFADTLRRGLRLSLFIGLPASIGLILVRDDLTRVLFSGGAGGFGPDALARSSAVLLGYAPAVWAYSLNHVFTRAFYARGDTATPVKIALGVLGLNLVLNIALIWWLREAGLAWATSIAAIVQCIILGFILRRQLGQPLLDPASYRSAFRTGVATCLMAIAVILAVLVVQTPTWTGQAISLFTACVVGLSVYIAAAAALRSEELRSLLSLR